MIGDVGDADAERAWLRGLAAGPIPELRRWIERRQLTLLGRGMGSDVFAAGPDHVIRLSAPGDECAAIYRMASRDGGRVSGWPRVFEVFWVPYGWAGADFDFLCISVLERVRVGTALPERVQLDLNRAMLEIDRIHRAFWSVRDTGPVRRSFEAMWREWTEPSRRLLDARTLAYANDLYTGLLAVKRWADPGMLDVKLANAGLTRDGRAVWVDFGV